LAISTTKPFYFSGELIFGDVYLQANIDFPGKKLVLKIEG